ncbi:MAG: B12-binding domain-containing radical SAM protein [Proteobacteria bacterium]|nr:B12-binding domain-containing radical SAM protein [Pseudomonadota bacterium]
MKILFIIKDIEYIDPMGIMLLSALAKEDGHTTELCVLAEGKLSEIIESFKPDIAAFSAKTGEHKYYIAANDAVKKIDKNIYTVIGGPHVTFFPDIIIKHPFDAICVGEGDDAWPELLSAVEAGTPVEDIPNIVTKKNYTTDMASVIRPRKRDLDTLPHLDRDLVYRSTRLGRFPMRSFMAGRGCPYKCTYCFNHIYNKLYKGKGKLYSRFSVDRLCAELKELKDTYPTQYIKFYDDIFVMKDDEWLDEFAEKYPREVGLPFHCLMRANLVTEPLLLKLKKAGLKSISMSIESGNAHIRDVLLKRNMSEEVMLDAFKLCKKHNIPTFSNTIFAIPGSSIKEDIEGLDLNIKAKVTFGEFPVFFPYPKTELGEYSIEHGYFDGDFDKLHMNYQTDSPLNCFSEKEKRMQVNLSLLATVCLLFPSLRNITVKLLIKLPLTKLYFIMYYFTKAYLIKTKIYPMKFSITDTLRTFYDSFILEKFKHQDDTSLSGEGSKEMHKP